MDSGVSEMKSQNVSWQVADCGKPRPVPFLRHDQVGEFDGILDEENRDVVADRSQLPSWV